MKKEAPLFQGKVLKAGAALLAVFTLVSVNGCSGKKESIRDAFAGTRVKYVVYIAKGDFLLQVYDRDLKVAAQYPVSYGINPDRKAKAYEGDKRTPEGLYYVNEILSMDAHKDSPSYKKLKGMNKVYFKAAKGYTKYGKPGVDQGDNVYGPRYFGIDYPNKNDEIRYKKLLKEGKIPVKKGKLCKIGYGIAIHGNNDEASIGHLASSGCVRMYNRDVVELERYIQIGTPVIISLR